MGNENSISFGFDYEMTCKNEKCDRYNKPFTITTNYEVTSYNCPTCGSACEVRRK